MGMDVSEGRSGVWCFKVTGQEIYHQIWPPWRLEDSEESAEEILLACHAGRRRNAR